MQRGISAVMAVLLIIVGCSSPTAEPGVPPGIVNGEDTCDRCGMIISDERFAAGLVVETAPGVLEHRVFDDIGGMFAYGQELGSAVAIVTYHVHDYRSKEWIDARTAHYVQAESLLSPMGFGIVALSTQTDAEALAGEWQGSVLNFEQASALAVELAVAAHYHAVHESQIYAHKLQTR